jgi:hypothetical protein
MGKKRFDAVLTTIAVLACLTIALAHIVKTLTTTATSTATKRKSLMKRKRVQVALALAALAAVASTSVGVTLALYSNKPTGETNTFSAGTVTLSNNVSSACSTTGMAPGDSATCTLITTYAGTLPGYMAMDVYIAAKSNAAGGGSPLALYNPSDTGNTATITLNSPSVSYAVPTTGSTLACGTGPDGVNYTTYNVCYQVVNYLVSLTAFSSGSVTFTTVLSMPAGQPNTYQGGSAVVVLTAHAVQSKNNTLNCTVGGTSPTAGAVCTASTGFAWS